MSCDGWWRLGRLALPLLVTGCALAQTQTPAPAPAGSSAAPVAKQDTEGLYRSIRETVGDAACTANEQCRTLPIGHKACGGPEGYLVWSSAATSESRLRALVDSYNQARKRDVQQSGRVSDCSMMADPGARCDAGRCVPAGRSPAVM
jgi:hypothetical protein